VRRKPDPISRRLKLGSRGSEPPNPPHPVEVVGANNSLLDIDHEGREVCRSPRSEGSLSAFCSKRDGYHGDCLFAFADLVLTTPLVTTFAPAMMPSGATVSLMGCIVRPPPTARVPSCVARREQCASSPVAVAMTSPADMYRINAAECERECARATTPALKQKYQDLAKQWRDMADRSAVRGSKRTQQIEPKAALPERSR
jgi:hypothetical protein